MATATFVFADIVGSTRLWDAHPDAMRSALAAHDDIASKVVNASGGTVFKHTGDGFIAVFATAGPAVEAAVAYQLALAATPFADVGTLSTRMGIHTGEVQERDDDYFGPTLNRAARLMSTASGGQILVSVVARRLAEGSPAEFQDLGEHRLRDLSESEQIFQVIADGLESEFPPLATADIVPNNLPTLTSSFVGREREMVEVKELVRSSRVVTISGVGGSGKTRLALQMAAELSPEFAGGTWFVELAAVTDPGLVAGHVARTLGAQEQPGATTEDAIVEFLSGREALFLVDNCEHLIDASADLVAEIVRRVPGLRVIATSRELLGVPGEVAYGLRSLALPSRDDTSPDALLEHDSVQLFVERAISAKPGYALTATDAPAVAEICRRLDGMPLAMELAAARLRTFSAGQIAENLDKRFRLLTGGSRTALPRQQTLAATIEWSYRLLDESERVLFDRLSVFSGGFTLESAMEVCAGEELDSFEVLELMPSLVDKSLVMADTSGSSARYRLLETIRQFARERFDESGGGDEYRLRHAEHFRDFALEARRHLRGPDEAEWWDRVGTELDNLRQSMTWALDADRPELALATAAAFWRYWWFTFAWSEGVEWTRRATTAADGRVDDLLLAEGLLAWGSLLEWDARDDTDLSILERSADLFRQLDAAGAPAEALRLNLCASLINLGAAISRRHPESPRVAELMREAVDAGQRIGDIAAVAVGAGNLSWQAARKGDREGARAIMAEAEEATASMGSAHRSVDLLGQKGLIELHLGEAESALAAFEEAVAAARAGGLPMAVGTYGALAAICEADLGIDGAVDRFRAGVAAAHEAATDPNPPDIQMFLAFLAEHEVTAGRPEYAARLLGAHETLASMGYEEVESFLVRLDRARTGVMDALGDAAGAFIAEGRALSYDEAVAAIVNAPPP